MPEKREVTWMANYNALKEYITEHHHLPNKRKVENRALLNWWKYNRKCIKLGKIEPYKIPLLDELSNMRTTKA